MKLSNETLQSYSLYIIFKVILTLHAARGLIAKAEEAEKEFGPDDPITKAYQAKLAAPTGGIPDSDINIIKEAMAAGVSPHEAMTAVLNQCKEAAIPINLGDPREIAALNGADNTSQSNWRVEACTAAVKKSGSMTIKQLEVVTGTTNLSTVLEKLAKVDGITRSDNTFSYNAA